MAFPKADTSLEMILPTLVTGVAMTTRASTMAPVIKKRKQSWSRLRTSFSGEDLEPHDLFRRLPSISSPGKLF
jgi:hypothetical protein